MSDPFDSWLQALQGNLDNLGLMQKLDVMHNPTNEDLWALSNSPLPGAANSRARLRYRLVRRALEQPFQPVGAAFPDVPPDQAVMPGIELCSHRPVVILRNLFRRHAIVCGSSGIGKTNLLVWLALQLLAAGINVLWADHKLEGRRLLELVPDARVIRADQDLVNILDPVGRPETYWAALFFELAKLANLRVEAWNELPEILVRIQKGLKPGQPFISLRDFCRILFEIATRERRPKLATVARAIRALNEVLGELSRVRRSPVHLLKRSRLVVLEYPGLPPRIQNFLAAVRLLRVQMQGAVDGHGTDLQSVYVSDEGTCEFGKEMSGEAGSGYVRANKRLITQIRCQGVGVIVAVQMLSELDDSVKANAATLIVFRCSNPKDANEAHVMLGMDGINDCVTRKLMTLPVGQAVIISEGFDRCTQIVIPHIPLGDYPSDAEVARRMKPALDELRRATEFSPAANDAVVPIASDDLPGNRVERPPSLPATPMPAAIVSADEQALMDEIGKAPTLGTTEHYVRISWNFRRGDKVKKRLLARGLIRLERLESKNGRPKEIMVIV